MAPSLISRAIVAVFFCGSSLAANTIGILQDPPSVAANTVGILQDVPSLLSKTSQLTGNFSYDGKYNLTFVITNNSVRNVTIPGTNNLFDRSNSIPANTSFKLTTLAGTQVRLNGSNYPAPPLSDAVFQAIPSGGVYTRSMNLSSYLLDNMGSGTPLPSDKLNQTFIATFPKFVYALDVTGIKDGENLATYYLSVGLKSVPIISTPYEFNYTLPKEFTPSQADAIEDDTSIRRLRDSEATGSGTINSSRRRFRRRV